MTSLSPVALLAAAPVAQLQPAAPAATGEFLELLGTIGEVDLDAVADEPPAAKVTTTEERAGDPDLATAVWASILPAPPAAPQPARAPAALEIAAPEAVGFAGEAPRAAPGNAEPRAIAEELERPAIPLEAFSETPALPQADRSTEPAEAVGERRVQKTERETVTCRAAVCPASATVERESRTTVAEVSAFDPPVETAAVEPQAPERPATPPPAEPPVPRTTERKNLGETRPESVGLQRPAVEITPTGKRASTPPPAEARPEAPGPVAVTPAIGPTVWQIAPPLNVAGEPGAAPRPPRVTPFSPTREDTPLTPEPPAEAAWSPPDSPERAVEVEAAAQPAMIPPNRRELPAPAAETMSTTAPAARVAAAPSRVALAFAARLTPAPTPATAGAPTPEAPSGREPSASSKAPLEVPPVPQDRKPEPSRPADASPHPAQTDTSQAATAAPRFTVHNDHTAPERRVEASPEPKPQAAATAPPQREPAPAAAVARDIRLQVGGPDRKVEVRLVERSGEVHLAVRTPDGRLAEGLREHLPQLSSRLEQSGFRADEWRAAEAGAAERRVDLQPASSASADTRQHGNSQHDRQQRDGEPHPPRDAGQQQRRNKEKGSPFPWLMESLR